MAVFYLPLKLVMKVITKGYVVRATTIEGQNAFAPSLCSSVVCVSFACGKSKHASSVRAIEGPNARDQTAFRAFHTFLVEVQTNAGWRQ